MENRFKNIGDGISVIELKNYPEEQLTGENLCKILNGELSNEWFDLAQYIVNETEKIIVFHIPQTIQVNFMESREQLLKVYSDVVIDIDGEKTYYSVTCHKKPK